MTEVLALAVLGGLFLGALTVAAIVVKKLWLSVFRRMPGDVEGMARATGRATAKAKQRAASIVQAFKEGSSEQ